MSILFVLLTFLLILTVMYFRRPEAAANTLQATLGQKITRRAVHDEAGRL